LKEGGWVCRPAPCIDHKTCEIKSRDPYLILGWIQRASQVNATEAALWLCYKEGFKGVGIWFHLRPCELKKYGLTITEDRNLKKRGGISRKHWTSGSRNFAKTIPVRS
jgi:hypothetical protein